MISGSGLRAKKQGVNGMSSENTTTVNSGIGLCGIMFVILFLLKVGVVETVVMGWSWWWITLPLWWGFAVLFGILGIAVCLGAVAGIIYLIYLGIKYLADKRG